MLSIPIKNLFKKSSFSNEATYTNKVYSNNRKINREFKKVKFVFILFILAIKLVLIANDKKLEQINSNNDQGLWLDQSITAKLSSLGTVKFRCEQRWGANYHIFFYREYELNFQFKIKQFLEKKTFLIFENATIGPVYNMTRSLQKNTREIFEWVWIKRPMLETNFVFSLCRWLIKHRLRGEYIEHTKKFHKNYSVFRYRLEFYSPWKLTRWKLNPYLSNESFFRENTYSYTHQHGLVGGLFENRFRIGFILELFKQFSAAIYWQWILRKKTPDIYPQFFNNYEIGFTTNLLSF